MGGKQTKHVTPRGVQIREGKHGTSIQICFSYRGVTCRESRRLEATRYNIKWMERQRVQILDEIERGTFNYRERFPNSPKAALFCGPVPTGQEVTVGEKLDAYFEHSKKRHKLSTYRGYRDLADAHLYPKFGQTRVRDLTVPILREWLKKLPMKLKTINNMLAPLRYILDEAVADEIIDSSPLNKIKVRQLVGKAQLESDIAPDPLDYDEIRAVLGYCCRKQERNFWQFAIFTGLRTGELIGLRWQDVDWVKCRIRVTNNVVDGVEDTVKTKAGERFVKLNSPALWALEQQRQHTYMAGDRVFHDPLYDAPWKNDVVLRGRWATLCKRAGVRFRKPYVTRQTFCSQMLSHGANPLYVAQQMGHVNMSMVIRHYGAWVENGLTPQGRPFEEWDEFCEESCTEFARGTKIASRHI